MFAVNQKARATIETLIEGLNVGSAKKIDNTEGVYMTLHVERLTENTFSLAHYYEQNGDLMPDPDMVFWRALTGDFYPVEITMATGYHQKLMHFGDDGQPSGFNPKGQKDAAGFAGTWCQNIRAQQGIKPAKKAA